MGDGAEQALAQRKRKADNHLGSQAEIPELDLRHRRRRSNRRRL
jgi:hypothetical protein